MIDNTSQINSYLSPKEEQSRMISEMHHMQQNKSLAMDSTNPQTIICLKPGPCLDLHLWRRIAVPIKPNHNATINQNVGLFGNSDGSRQLRKSPQQLFDTGSWLDFDVFLLCSWSLNLSLQVPAYLCHAHHSRENYHPLHVSLKNQSLTLAK